MLAPVRRFLSPLAIRRSTWRDLPDFAPRALEGAARLGYAVRGLIYLTVGVITVLAVVVRSIDPTSPSGALGWIAQQPFSWVWLLLTAGGLIAFSGWRLLQGVFDIDRQGLFVDALSMRMSQTFSALGYAALAWIALGLIFHTPGDPAAAEAWRTHRHAAQVLALPHGEWMLAGVGLAVGGVGVANVARAWREDFTAHLSCSEAVCRWLAPLARAGYMARGFAYLPLAALVLIAAVRSRPSDVTSLGGALNALADQPFGRIALGLAALGLMAFGAFSLIEARFRRIRTGGR